MARPVAAEPLERLEKAVDVAGGDDRCYELRSAVMSMASAALDRPGLS
jgi:hypothetical protein